MLHEFGLELGAEVEIHVWDSTAEVRYIVVPERPAGTADFTEDQLAALVTRDSMVGVAKVGAASREQRMNGVHDLGGMHGMGPIAYEHNEPVFHEPGRGGVALIRAVRGWRKSTADADRHAIEQLPPADYLRPYYERRLVGFLTIVKRNGFIISEELERGKAALGSRKTTPPLTAAMSPGYVNRGIPSAIEPTISHDSRSVSVSARETSIPSAIRACRDTRAARVGTITRDHGVYNFPDTNAHGLGAKRQHVYSVRFSSTELWGESAAARSVVHLDCGTII